MLSLRNYGLPPAHTFLLMGRIVGGVVILRRGRVGVGHSQKSEREKSSSRIESGSTK